MKFFEAVEIARKTGKSIQANGGGVAYWDGIYLRWEPRETRHNVLLSSYNLDDDWKVIEPPAERVRLRRSVPDDEGGEVDEAGW